jgi:hypothetical protein
MANGKLQILNFRFQKEGEGSDGAGESDIAEGADEAVEHFPIAGFGAQISKR